MSIHKSVTSKGVKRLKKLQIYLSICKYLHNTVLSNVIHSYLSYSNVASTKDSQCRGGFIKLCKLYTYREEYNPTTCGFNHLFISMSAITKKKRRLLHAIKIIKPNRKQVCNLLGCVVTFRGQKNQ